MSVKLNDGSAAGTFVSYLVLDLDLLDSVEEQCRRPLSVERTIFQRHCSWGLHR